MQDNGTMNHTNKKELAVFNKELEKLQKTLGGIKNMRGKADILFVIDQQEEEIAITEAKIIGLKVVAVIDTNCDPQGIDYPIPGNDDSIRSVKLIISTVADAIIEGHEGKVPDVHKTKNGYVKKLSNIQPPVKLVQEIAIPVEQQS